MPILCRGTRQRNQHNYNYGGYDDDDTNRHNNTAAGSITRQMQVANLGMPAQQAIKKTTITVPKMKDNAAMCSGIALSMTR